MKQRKSRIVAYVIVPLFFTMIGYGVVYVAASPFINIVTTAGSMFMTESLPEFSEELGSIFSEPDKDTEAEEIPLADVTWPKFGEHYANVTCEQIGLDVPLYYDDSMEIMRVGAGQYQGSFIPGYGKTILLSGHNTTYFSPLQKIAVGDEVTIKTSYGIYRYQVRETKILNESDPQAVDLLQKKEELVMYTCYPFDMLSSTDQRFFVYADKVSGPVLK